jgi:hypothetical protein
MAIETIVAAIVGAVSAGATETGKKVVGDAYEGLKSLIKKRFGEKSEAAVAVEKLEASPGSEGRKITLAEELEAVGAGVDKEFVKAAEAVLAKIRELPQGTRIQQTATGDGNIQIAGHGVSVNAGSSGRSDDGG